MLGGRWLWGRPTQCLPLGEFTFRYRGIVAFQIERDGLMWFCYDGFQTPPSLSDRKSNRDQGLSANDRGLTSLMHEGGWGSFTKNGCIRWVCRDIDRELAKLDRENQRYLEAKGTRAFA